MKSKTATRLTVLEQCLVEIRNVLNEEDGSVGIYAYGEYTPTDAPFIHTLCLGFIPKVHFLEAEATATALPFTNGRHRTTLQYVSDGYMGWWDVAVLIDYKKLARSQARADAEEFEQRLITAMSEEH